jgi:hypothetical protein
MHHSIIFRGCLLQVAGNDVAGAGQSKGSRLETVNEAQVSKGSLLSDLSYSHCEDDLDSTLLRCGKLLPPPVATSNKGWRSAVEKMVKLDGVGMHAKTEVVKTTVTVGKEGGTMKASAILEALQAVKLESSAIISKNLKTTITVVSLMSHYCFLL